MFKKLIITSVALSLLLTSAGGAFAHDRDHNTGSMAFLDISNSGCITNNVNTSSNTGANSLTTVGMMGSGIINSSINTGAANSSANVQSQLNWNQANGSLSLSGVKMLDFDLNNHGHIANNINTSAYTGNNTMTASGGISFIYQSPMGTGVANSSSVVSSIVNTNMFNVDTSK